MLITGRGLVGNTAVELEMPAQGGVSVLQPGDTLEAERIATMLDAPRSTPGTLVLERLAGTMDRTDHILATIEPRPMADSVVTTLGDTRILVRDMQSLVDTASSMATQNAAVFAEIMQSLERTAEVAAHFADQVSRRPLRMFTGVTPPDSMEDR